MICATGIGAERPFATTVTNVVPDLNFYGPGTVPKWFPFYTYDEDGTNRRENITDWALAEFRKHYERSAGKHPSGAKARAVLWDSGGTTEVVPFQNPVEQGKGTKLPSSIFFTTHTGCCIIRSTERGMRRI